MRKTALGCIGEKVRAHAIQPAINLPSRSRIPRLLSGSPYKIKPDNPPGHGWALRPVSGCAGGLNGTSSRGREGNLPVRLSPQGLSFRILVAIKGWI